MALGRGASDPTNRIVYRHDKILKVMVDAIREHVDEKFTTVTVDLKHDSENYAALPKEGPLLPHIEMLGSLRPDIVLENDKEIIIGELTSPMEHNMASANTKKAQKYSAFKLPDDDDREVVVLPFEVGARGGVNRTLSCFLTYVGLTKKQVRVTKEKVSKAAINASQQIFAAKNRKDWIVPPI